MRIKPILWLEYSSGLRPRPPRLAASKNDISLKSSHSSCHVPSSPCSCSLESYSDTGLFEKSLKISPQEAGEGPGRAKKGPSGGFDPEMPSETPFGGDFGAMLGAKLEAKILLFCWEKNSRGPRGASGGDFLEV